MRVIHWEWPCHSRDTEQRKMFSYRRRGKKKVVIKSKCRLYHATRLRQRCGWDEVCWAPPWKFLRNPRTIGSITAVLRARPAEFAKFSVTRSRRATLGLWLGGPVVPIFQIRKWSLGDSWTASLRSGSRAALCVAHTSPRPAFGVLSLEEAELRSAARGLRFPNSLGQPRQLW